MQVLASISVFGSAMFFLGMATTLRAQTFEPSQVPLRTDAPTVIGLIKFEKAGVLQGVQGRITGDIAAVKLITIGGSTAELDRDTGVFEIGMETKMVKKEPALMELQLSERATLLSRIGVAVHSFEVDGKTTDLEATVTTYRPGAKVRHKGDGGSLGYRIPCLVTTKAGSLLAAYDVRYEGRRDLQGHMDIGISRSTDKGETWEPMRIALGMGEFGGLSQKYNGVSDANLLVDQVTGRIWCFGLWMHGVNDKQGVWQGGKGWIHQWHEGGSNPGHDIKGTSQLLACHSDDDGKSWSASTNLTRMVKREAGWHLYAPAPGNGITLKDGTLVVPTQGLDAERRQFSTLMWSKDRGQTWTTATPANDLSENVRANECAVVELPDGRLMLNARDPARTKRRGVFVTGDLGQTWVPHPSDHKALIEPTCMASLISRPHSDQFLLLFSNPDSTSKRQRMTIKASLDLGLTWPTDWQLLLDAKGGAYSSLANVDGDSVGILYESSQADLLYQRVRLGEILSR